MTFSPIPARLQSHVDNSDPAYYVKTDGEWIPTSYRDYARQVRVAGRALIKLGIEAGETVCILGFNRPEWCIFDLAAMSIGAAPAGIYTTCSAPEVEYIIAHAESRIVLLEDAGQWAKVEARLDQLPKLKVVVMMSGADKIEHDLILSWEEFLAQGADEALDEAFDARLAGLKEDDLATLIYTSGTTGPPKGVMLSHRNLAWTARSVEELMGVFPGDTSLSYLPLSHIAEQMFSLHVPVTYGSSIHFAESIEVVADNLKEVQPTVVFGVPRIWEKIYAGVSSKLAAASGAKAKLVQWALAVGRQANGYRNQGLEVPVALKVQYRLANKLIFSKVKPAIGLGRARICVSGAAPISKEILEFFCGLDFVVHEVYGQSEDSGPTSFNVPGRTRMGTVGPILPGVQVKIAEDGEILVRGPNVFQGYFKDPAATKSTLIDGWLHSGDLGSIDADGFLSITGRKKDIIITAGGKNIAPKNIESALKNLPLVAEAVVIGDRRKYLSALIVVDADALESFASQHELEPADAQGSSALIETLQRGVDGVNELFARVEHIRRFRVLPRPLTIEDGELTPTLKVKRNVVNEHFSELIEAIYADS